MTRITSTQTKRAAAGALLVVLSVVPYAIVYVIDRVFEVQHAARAALWPTAVVPLLVAAVVLTQALSGRSSSRARPATVRPLGRREHQRAA